MRGWKNMKTNKTEITAQRIRKWLSSNTYAGLWSAEGVYYFGTEEKKMVETRELTLEPATGRKYEILVKIKKIQGKW